MARREGRARCRIAEQRRARRLTLRHWVPLEEAPQRLVSIQVPPARRQQQGHALALLHLIVLTWAHHQHRPAALASLVERHIRTRQACTVDTYFLAVSGVTPRTSTNQHTKRSTTSSSRSFASSDASGPSTRRASSPSPRQMNKIHHRTPVAESPPTPS
mmetsp:Transcript_23112/g.54986  ORF Transcript_23112/g.54986 Transcript_23112/m.54986 type:complete len:159 (-) Transcript_23112:1288-1764(-)